MTVRASSPDAVRSNFAVSGITVDPIGFDALRLDSYEKHVARRSLTELDRLYSILLNPLKGSGGLWRDKCR